MDGAIFVGLDLESWRNRAFELCWTAHGGSGLGLSWQDVLEMDAGDANWLYKAVDRRRGEEAKAIKAAAKSGR